MTDSKDRLLLEKLAAYVESELRIENGAERFKKFCEAIEALERDGGKVYVCYPMKVVEKFRATIGPTGPAGPPHQSDSIGK